VDFDLSQDEQMIIESAAKYSQRYLKASVRSHEEAGGLGEEVISAFDESGLGMLSEPVGDPEMELSWPLRCLVLAELATVDGPSAFALWMRSWTPKALAMLGGEGEPHGLGLVRDIDELAWPMPCLPVMDSEQVLVVDLAGRWGLAKVEATPIRALGMGAAAPSRCELVEWIQRGEADPGMAAAICGQARLWISSILVGMSRGATEYAHQYIQERVAFGKALAQHQGVAFMAADMAIRCEGAELLLCRVGWEMDAGDHTHTPGVYAEAVEAALWVTDVGVQLLGGHGYMKEHPVEKWMRDARAISLIWGGVDLALEAERDMARGTG